MKVDIYNTDKKYNIIYADPPWSYRNMDNIQATANSHYHTMNQQSIENLGGVIQGLAAKELAERHNTSIKCIYWHCYSNRWKNKPHTRGGYEVFEVEENEE